jgi:transposase-like protein
MAGRGISVDHVSIYRWVQRFAPEFNGSAPARGEVMTGPSAFSKCDASSEIKDSLYNPIEERY